jgi:hypothetical protein
VQTVYYKVTPSDGSKPWFVQAYREDERFVYGHEATYEREVA